MECKTATFLPLYGWITDHVLFGSGRGWLKRGKLESVLAGLANSGVIAQEGPRWRLAEFIDRDAARGHYEPEPGREGWPRD